MLAKKVEELNELRVEKLNRVKLVEKEKDELEGPMKDALGFLRLENEKVEKTYRQRASFLSLCDIKPCLVWPSCLVAV